MNDLKLTESLRETLWRVWERRAAGHPPLFNLTVRRGTRSLSHASRVALTRLGLIERFDWRAEAAVKQPHSAVPEFIYVRITEVGLCRLREGDKNDS